MAETLDSAQPRPWQRGQKLSSSYVYLLHFSAPIGNQCTPHGQAQHYLGYAPDGTINRIVTHKRGQGAAITRAAVNSYHRSMTLARTWSGDATLERKLKAYKNAPLLCPICNERAHNLGNFYHLMHFEHVRPQEIEQRLGQGSHRRSKVSPSPLAAS